MKDNRVAMLLTGAGIGAAVALLFARHSGAELRKQIARLTGEATTSLKAKATALGDRVTKTAERQIGEVNDVVRDLNQKASAIVEDASRIMSKAGSEVHDASRAVVSKVGR